MIRRAVETDFIRDITSESELRVCALKHAYGLDASFIQYFADDKGSIAGLMDGFCSFHCAGELNDEWRAFLGMHADIRTLHTEEPIARALALEQPYSVRSGVVLRYSDVTSETPLQAESVENPSLRGVYSLISAVFATLPNFDSWYVDTSHRFRHGCCHIAASCADGDIVSVAMTVAETETTALIGGVATLPNFRRQGKASYCIKGLIAQLPQRELLIAPNNEDAARLYGKLGFVPWGTWAELDVSR